MGTPCELTRAFRNENLWIGTCFQESPDSCIQESKRPASPVFMRVLRTVTRAREFNFLNSLTVCSWRLARIRRIGTMLTLEGPSSLRPRRSTPEACIDDAREVVQARCNLAYDVLLPFLALSLPFSSFAALAVATSKAKERPCNSPAKLSNAGDRGRICEVGPPQAVGLTSLARIRTSCSMGILLCEAVGYRRLEV